MWKIRVHEEAVNNICNKNNVNCYKLQLLISESLSAKTGNIPISPQDVIISYCHSYIKGVASIPKCKKVFISALYN